MPRDRLLHVLEPWRYRGAPPIVDNLDTCQRVERGEDYPRGTKLKAVQESLIYVY